MKKLLQLTFRAGCLASVIAPVTAIIVYPRANWLFAFPLLGIGLIVFGIMTRKQPTPTEVADRAEHLLDGSDGGYGRWAVDDYEHLNPKSVLLKDLWRRTMSIGGLPEEWIKLDDEAKAKMLDVIAEIKRLESTGPLSTGAAVMTNEPPSSARPDSRGRLSLHGSLHFF